MADKKSIRDEYFDLTGDAEGAYASLPDDSETFRFGENALQRAIDAIKEADPYGERPYIIDAIWQEGPMLGTTMGKAYDLSPQAGYASVMDNMGYADQARAFDEGIGKWVDYAKGKASAFGNLLHPSLNRNYGAAQGLIDYYIKGIK
jgi:hypothetical protein